MKCATVRGLRCFYHGFSINDISACAWDLGDKKKSDDFSHRDVAKSHLPANFIF